jgi:hypothetical protein
MNHPNTLLILCISAVMFAASGCSKNDGGNATTPAPTATPAPADTAPAPAPAPETAPPPETTPPPTEPPKI